MDSGPQASIFEWHLQPNIVNSHRLTVYKSNKYPLRRCDWWAPRSSTRCVPRDLSPYLPHEGHKVQGQGVVLQRVGDISDQSRRLAVPEVVYEGVPPDARQLPVTSGSRAQSEGAGRHPQVSALVCELAGPLERDRSAAKTFGGWPEPGHLEAGRNPDIWRLAGTRTRQPRPQETF